MPERMELPPERKAKLALRVLLLYGIVLTTQAAAFLVVRASLPPGTNLRPVLLPMLAVVALADTGIVLLNLSLRKYFLQSRDEMARYGAGQIVSLLDILNLETELLRFVGESVSGRLAERGLGVAFGEALEDLKEISGLVEKAKSLLNGKKGRQEAFYNHMADAVDRFRVIFPRLQGVEKEMIGLIVQVLDEFKDSRESLYRYMFFLSETGTILERMSHESNRYSTGKMEKILAGFKDLAEFSGKIGTDSSAIMRDIMDASGRSSIGAIARESSAISSELESFFRDMDSLRVFFDEIVSANSKQLANIRKMAEGIEDFSETIRIISMNVNIEAARLSSSSAGSDARKSGRGFQVLAKNMSDFAQRAQDLAKDERRVIDEAEGALTGVNSRFLKRLDELMNRVPAIRARLDPFAGIIKDSFANLEAVVWTLGGLSGAVDQRLKAIIGQLQFQDLTRQELEHIVTFLSDTLSLKGEFGSLSFNIAGLPEEDQLELRKRAMRIYGELSTTINERRVIDAYSSEHGIPLEEVERISGAEGAGDAETDGELGDGSIRLF